MEILYSDVPNGAVILTSLSAEMTDNSSVLLSETQPFVVANTIYLSFKMTAEHMIGLVPIDVESKEMCYGYVSTV